MDSAQSFIVQEYITKEARIMHHDNIYGKLYHSSKDMSRTKYHTNQKLHPGFRHMPEQAGCHLKS